MTEVTLGPEPETMTRRARAYLTIAAVRHGLVGLSLLWLPWLYGSAAFLPLFGLLPLWVWGVLMVVTSGLAVFAAATRSGDVARVAMIASAVITLVLAAGVSIGVVAMWSTWSAAVGWGAIWGLLAHPVAALPAGLLSVAVAPPSPFLPLLLLSITAKDFVMCSQPMRTPFEPVVRLMLNEEGVTP